jgi:hypothetical protein
MTSSSFSSAGSSSGSSGQYQVPQVDESALYATETTGGVAAAHASAGGGSGSDGSGAGSAGPSFQVDGDGVRAQAAIIAQCGSQAADVLTRLRGQLASAGEPWGTDDLGKSFGHSYMDPANMGFTSMAGLGAALVNVANALYAQAENWDALEGLITQKVSGVAEQTNESGQNEPSQAEQPGQAVPA